MNKKRLKIIVIVFFTFLFFCFTIFLLFYLRTNPRVLSGFDVGGDDGLLKVYFLDVGQGDSILIRTPAGDDILIDGGPDNAVVRKLGEYLPVYNRDIELMILTHPHADHVAGLNEVLARYEVDKVITTGVKYTSADYFAFLDLLVEKNIETKIITSPEIIDLGLVELEILYPTSTLAGLSLDNVNNASIVTRVVYASTSAMLTGDLENEEFLIEAGVELDSDIFKAGHHGSNNANDKSFVQAVSPQYVVVSCGADNSFGHPHYRAMKNFERVGAQVYRTDQMGDVVFYSDGQVFYIKN